MKQAYGYIDLHLHLDGSLSPATARTLAQRANISLPEGEEDLEKLLSCSPQCRDLNEYLTKFDLPCRLMQTEENLEEAAFALCRELQEKRYVYAEIRFAPQKHQSLGLCQQAVVEAVLSGIRKSGFFAQLILCCMRDGIDNSFENEETVRLTERFLGKGVCACDLAGAEALYPNEYYAPLFRQAKAREIPFTIHAGEALGAESVDLALDMGASRIGHGVRGVERESTLERLAHMGVPLEICPTSNVQTGIFPSVSAMPIPTLIQKGVLVTVNADNMTVSQTDVPRETEKLFQAFPRWNLKSLLYENAVKAAFLTQEEKKKLLSPMK